MGKKWNQKQNQKHFFDQSWYPQINENSDYKFFRSRTESQDTNSYRGIILHFTLRNIIHYGFNRTSKDFCTFWQTHRKITPFQMDISIGTCLSFLIIYITMYLRLGRMNCLYFFFLSIPLTYFLDCQLCSSGTYIKSRRTLLLICLSPEDSFLLCEDVAISTAMRFVKSKREVLLTHFPLEKVC